MRKIILPAVLLLALSTNTSISAQEQDARGIQERLQAHVYTLASDELAGREPGTEGDSLAQKYISEQFAKLPGVEMLGDNGLQRFSYPAKRALLEEGNSLKIGKRNFVMGRDFIPSLNSNVGEFSGEVVDMGRGKAFEYEGKDVKDKFVLVHLEELGYTDGGTQRGLESIAIKAGAQGIIFVGQPLTNAMARYPSGPKFLVLKVTEPVARELQSKKQLAATVAIETLTEKTANVVAKISAPKELNPDGDVLILGAHFDHMGREEYEGRPAIFYGADDNASGTAGIMELAHMISQRRDFLRKDVIFIAFGAEERGLKGSRYYAENPIEPLEKVKVMVNIDMMGRMVAKGLTIRGVGTAHEGPALFSTLPNNEMLDIAWEHRGTGPTDYTPFYNKGIPAFSFGTRHHPDYHKPTDTRENVNYEGMKSTYLYIENLINRLAFEPLRLTFKKTE